MHNILIVEDDPRISRALDRQFRSEGHSVHLVANGLEAAHVCVELRPTAVVLDLMLPGLSGRDACKQIKSAMPNLPVIILSAVSAVADKVLLLEIGADDSFRDILCQLLFRKVTAIVPLSFFTKRRPLATYLSWDAWGVHAPKRRSS